MRRSWQVSVGVAPSVRQRASERNSRALLRRARLSRPSIIVYARGMRAPIVIVCLLAWLAAPVAQAWPERCAHEPPPAGHLSDSGMHDHMAMQGGAHDTTETDAPCPCDDDCAQHCDTAPSPALAAFSVTEDESRPQRHRYFVVSSFYLDPPGSDLLRPPQLQRR